MKVSGFTFIRNAVKLEYPIIPAIESILPLCDEVVVAVGNSDDGTRQLIENIPSKKIKIIDTIWDDALRVGGAVLAQETNKALHHISADSTWAVYIQGDEVLHEDGLAILKKAMEKDAENPSVEALLVNYRHFYGSYDYIGNSRRWYRREIRVIRNTGKVTSYKDAQGFRRLDNTKLNARLTDAYMHHYGWVRSPFAQQEKQKSFHRYWHDDQWVEDKVAKAAEFDYAQIDSLERFSGTHPKAMQKTIDAMNWKFDHDVSIDKRRFKEKISEKIEKLTGWRMGEYKNYTLLK